MCEASLKQMQAESGSRGSSRGTPAEPHRLERLGSENADGKSYSKLGRVLASNQDLDGLLKQPSPKEAFQRSYACSMTQVLQESSPRRKMQRWSLQLKSTEHLP